MRRTTVVVALLIVSLASLSFSPAVAATDQLDQSYTGCCFTYDIYNSGPTKNDVISESYTAGINGTLDRISLNLKVSLASATRNLNVAIYATDSTGNPTGSALETIGITPTLSNRCQWIDVSGLSVPQVAGTQYAIVVSSSDSDITAWCGNSPWSGGMAYSSTNGGTTWFSLSPYDFGFKTYVVPASVDTTPPVITFSVSGMLGNNGWYTSDVTVSWSVQDSESAITSSSGCDTSNITTDTPGITLSCTATSAGGTSYQSVTVMRDATPPVLAPIVSPNPVLLDGTATAYPNASDATSGVAISSCDPVDTGSVGVHTVNCRASDVAGNQSSASTSYTVAYDFSGFSSPVDNSGLNTANAGETVPLKWRLTDANGNPVTTLRSVTVTAETLQCSIGTTPDLAQETSAGNSGLQNLGDGYYQFNWKTPQSYARSCKTLRLNLGDGNGASPIYHTANFEFTQ